MSKRIIKSIAFPKSAPQSKYPFADLEPGDGLSFRTTLEFKRARSAVSVFQMRHPGTVFETRREKKGGGKIRRVK